MQIERLHDRGAPFQASLITKVYEARYLPVAASYFTESAGRQRQQWMAGCGMNELHRIQSDSPALQKEGSSRRSLTWGQGGCGWVVGDARAARAAGGATQLHLGRPVLPIECQRNPVDLAISVHLLKEESGG